MKISSGWRNVWVCKKLVFVWNTVDEDGGAHLATTARIRDA